MAHTFRVVLFLLILPALSNAASHLIRVPSDAATIQLGINAAVTGDTVLVGQGKYRENINFRGKNIVLTSGYYQSGDSSLIGSTIIDGSTAAFPDTGSVVLIVNHEDSTAILQGFTIQGGSGTKWTDEHGSGVFREGGGILTESSSPTIKNNVIINNAVVMGTGVVSAGGGGIRSGDGNPHIVNNIIAGNTGRYGAGVVLNFTDAYIANNIITGNKGGQDFGGGAVWMNHPGASSKTVENNTITGNTASGGGIYVWFGSLTIVRNNIIWGNTAPEVSVRTGNALSVSYCDIRGGYAGSGNIDRDPGFMDPVFHLSDTSACIDGGDPDAAFQDPRNPAVQGSALWPSKGTLRNDIGAYGGSRRTSFLQSLPLTGIGSTKTEPSPLLFTLKQNYPNPFNPSTRIEYDISAPGEVRLIIFDILGKAISELVHEHQTAGGYSRTWSAVGVASGTYYYRLSLVTEKGEYSSKVRRLVVLK